MFGVKQSGMVEKSDLVKRLMWKSFASTFASGSKVPRRTGISDFIKMLEKESISGKVAGTNNNSGWKIKDYLAHPVCVPGKREESGGEDSASKKSVTLDSRSENTSIRRNQKTINRCKHGVNSVPLSWKRVYPSSRKKIDQIIEKASKAYNVPQNIIRGIIRAESGFNERAVSKAGAMGLMQLMPGTAKELGVTNPFDVEQNIEGGVKYLRKMLDRFDGNLIHALAAYNAGPGAVTKHGGVPPYKETRNYVKRVLKYSGLA